MDVQWLLNLPQQVEGSDPSSTSQFILRPGDRLTASVLEVDKGRDALLSFGQFKAYARLPLPVVTGQRIQIQIQQHESGMRMILQPPVSGGPAAVSPSADNLQIGLFEPVSDSPILRTHSHLLKAGEAIMGRVTGFGKNGLTLVDFGKFKAFAKIDVPVREGQILPLTVGKSDTGVTFTLSSRTTAHAAGWSTASPETAGLDPVRDPGAGLPADLRGLSNAQPRSPGGGDAIPRAGVMQSAGPIPPPTAAELAKFGERIQQLLDRFVPPDQTTRPPLPQSAEAALNHLQGVLRPIATTGDSAVLMAGLRDFVENSGFYFEKRVESVLRRLQARPSSMTTEDLARHPSIRKLMVNDLKPNLLIINEFIDSQLVGQKKAGRHELEMVKGMVHRLLSQIEHQQHGAAEKPADPNLWQAFSHMLLLDDNRHAARLKIYYPRKGRDDEAQKPPRVALLLEMDRLGTVRADLWMVGSDLNITFFVQTEETRSGIKTAGDEIKAALNDSFNTVCVTVVVNADKIDRFDGEDLNPAQRRLLDLSI